MYKLVYTVFKTIFLSMMLIFVFDIGFYMYRALSVNQRMESLMTSMQKIVIENNYLPEQDFAMYESIFQQLSDDMNNGDVFITGIGMNYNTNAQGSGVLEHLYSTDDTRGTVDDLLVKKMDKPAQYGDVMICQARVQIAQPVWGFGTAKTGYADTAYHDYDGEDSTKWNRVGYRTVTLYYTYYVPCLNYTSVEDI